MMNILNTFISIASVCVVEDGNRKSGESITTNGFGRVKYIIMVVQNTLYLMDTNSYCGRAAILWFQKRDKTWEW